MEQIVLSIHIIVSLALIGFILMQHGKGADAGASFGSGGGASQTIFGSRGTGDFLTHTTAILVTLFFITSLTLGYLTANRVKPQNLDELLNKVQPVESQKAPEPKKTHSDIPE